MRPAGISFPVGWLRRAVLRCAFSCHSPKRSHGALRVASAGKDNPMIEFTANELLRRQSVGDISAEAITQSFLSRIRQHDIRTKAFLLVDESRAIEQARAVDGKRRRGEPVGKLAGIPVAVKDVLC